MQQILSTMRKAIEEYGLIQNGDRIGVGISGGKDSVLLLMGLARLKTFLPVSFDLVGITLDPEFGNIPGDYSAIASLCASHDIPYLLKRTQIGPVIFDIRKESNPCSLCARMRRGALHDAAKEAGCNKIALGHHYDDAVETFLMNLFHEGRLGCFSPSSYLSRKDLTMIRPMVFTSEQEISSAAKRLAVPIVKSRCPVDGYTSRQKMKEYLAERERQDPGFKKRIFGAMKRAGIDGW